MKRIEFRAMGCRMLAAVESPSPQAELALHRLPAWFEGWEQVLSRFRPDSELSRLNRQTGRPVAVSETLWEVFHAAREAERRSGGLVTATVLDALLSAGYEHSFELLPAVQSAPAWTLPVPADPLASVGWDPSGRILELPTSVHLDLGGIAKGWAATKAAGRLASYGPALVDAGGDIAIGRPLPGGQPWPVGINDPFQPGTDFETLKLQTCGIATSGKDYHRWLRDGRWAHHIIDPRTGLPAVTDVLAATVVAPTAMEAETTAKTALILGSLSGLEWIDADPALAGVLVLEDGTRLYSALMDRYLWRAS